MANGSWTDRESATVSRADRSAATNDLVLYTVVPHTTSLRGSQREVSIPKNFLKPGAFHVQQIQAVGRARFEQRLGTLTDQEFVEIASRIQELLGIT